MARKIFATGTMVKSKITFSDPITHVVVDPSAVTVTIRSPDNVKVTYTYGTDVLLVKASTGIYHVLTPLAQQGTYKWKWTGSATQQAVVVIDECDSEAEAGF